MLRDNVKKEITPQLAACIHAPRTATTRGRRTRDLGHSLSGEAPGTPGLAHACPADLLLLAGLPVCSSIATLKLRVGFDAMHARPCKCMFCILVAVVAPITCVEFGALHARSHTCMSCRSVAIAHIVCGFRCYAHQVLHKYDLQIFCKTRLDKC